MPRQTNFAAGELSPFLHGRSDMSEHSKGARTLKNFFVSQEGNAVSRPGTSYVRNTKLSSPPRLIPFVVSDTESFVVEFGAHYIRFHRNGATLLDDNTLANSPSIGTPLTINFLEYEENELRDLQYAQVGDTLFIAHPKYPLRKLSRDSTGAWTFTTVFYDDLQPSFVAIEGYPLGAYAPTIAPRLVNVGSTLFYLDSEHPPREWKWRVSATMREFSTGKTFETLAVPVAEYYDGVTVGPGTAIPPDTGVVLYPDAPVTLKRYPNGGTDIYALTHEILHFNYYRGRGDLFGFVGSSKSLEFVDNGAEPDYQTQPVFGTDPYQAARGENPNSVGFFQERRIFGGTTFRPTSVIASASGNYSDFDKHTLPMPGQALELELASRYRERIRWVMGLRSLVIGTDVNIWALGGTDSDVLDYDSVYARPIDSVGATTLRPLVIGSTLLYVRTKGRGVRAITQTDNGWSPADISRNARHLFVGGEVSGINGESQLLTFGHTRQIVDWCYAEDPWGVTWAVRDDGVLLSCTISPNGDVAWTRHETDGFVKAICSVPETSEDAVYLAVNRSGSEQDATYFIERFTSRVENDSAEDDACVDACLRFETEPQLTYAGLDHLNGKQVWVVAVGNVPRGPYTVSGGQITLSTPLTANDVNLGGGPDVVVAYVGLPFTCDLEALDYIPGGEGRTKQKTVRSVGFEVSNSRGLYAGQDFGHLTEWRQRDVETGYNAPSNASALVKVAVAGTWDMFSRACLRQTLPLPVTVLGIVREVDIGG